MCCPWWQVLRDLLLPLSWFRSFCCIFSPLPSWGWSSFGGHLMFSHGDSIPPPNIRALLRHAPNCPTAGVWDRYMWWDGPGWGWCTSREGNAENKDLSPLSRTQSSPLLSTHLRWALENKSSIFQKHFDLLFLRSVQTGLQTPQPAWEVLSSVSVTRKSESLLCSPQPWARSLSGFVNHLPALLHSPGRHFHSTLSSKTSSLLWY